MIKRRVLLAAAGTSFVAGCLASGTFGHDEPEFTEYDIAVEDTEAEGDVSLDASVENDITEDEPGRITTSLRNQADQTLKFSLFGESTTPFNGVWFAHIEDDACLFVRAEFAPEGQNGCWIDANDFDASANIPEVTPGANVTDTVAVFGDSYTDVEDWEAPSAPCMIEGEYIGEEEIDLLERSETGDEAMLDTVTYQLRISLTERR